MLVKIFLVNAIFFAYSNSHPTNNFLIKGPTSNAKIYGPDGSKIISEADAGSISSHGIIGATHNSYIIDGNGHVKVFGDNPKLPTNQEYGDLQPSHNIFNFIPEKLPCENCKNDATAPSVTNIGSASDNIGAASYNQFDVKGESNTKSNPNSYDVTVAGPDSSSLIKATFTEGIIRTNSHASTNQNANDNYGSQPNSPSVSIIGPSSTAVIGNFAEGSHKYHEYTSGAKFKGPYTKSNQDFDINQPNYHPTVTEDNNNKNQQKTQEQKMSTENVMSSSSSERQVQENSNPTSTIDRTHTKLTKTQLREIDSSATSLSNSVRQPMNPTVTAEGPSTSTATRTSGIENRKDYSFSTMHNNHPNQNPQVIGTQQAGNNQRPTVMDDEAKNQQVLPELSTGNIGATSNKYNLFNAIHGHEQFISTSHSLTPPINHAGFHHVIDNRNEYHNTQSNIADCFHIVLPGYANIPAGNYAIYFKRISDINH